VNAPAPVLEWQGAGDPRSAVTLEQLLRMVDGLDFLEDYVEGDTSNVIDMLFGGGKEDVAAYAASQPLAHPPGSFWSYSSGTSNIVARIAGSTVGGGEHEALGYLQRELFDRLGMTSAKPRFDTAGTFIGSSFVFATARDFARFGLLYLRDGIWEGERVLPPGWVDHARTPTPASKGEYGAHWWLALDGSGRFSANGYRGQYILCDPARDLVVVRLGGSTPEQRGHVARNLLEIVESFPLVSPPTS
jgi:CubicO group peptidase (beta-lactamase class C family)